MKRLHRAPLRVLVLCVAAGLVGLAACQSTTHTTAPVDGAHDAPASASTSPRPPSSGAAGTATTTSHDEPGVLGSMSPDAFGRGVPSPFRASPNAADVTPDAGPKMCGCSLCAPLPSTDACTTDADCAPSSPCHAPACVAKAKATPRKPGMMCTESMGCQTADANACTCWKGTCALTPRSKP